MPVRVEGVAVARPETVDAGTCVSVADPTQHRSLFAAILELSKPRITRLVTMTAGVGFVLSLVERAAAAKTVGVARPWTVTELAVGALGCIAGTAISSGGANALNQWWERQRDARMRRTMNRPIPAGAVPACVGLWAGMAMSIVGVGILLAACGPAAALVSLATILIYVLIYTPSKVLTPWNTLIGAIPGALPPLIGWCAAAAIGASTRPWWGSLADLGGWSLFALMTVWQIPHFLALAWMYRDDYAAGGYRMLPSIDPTGRLTAWVSLVGAIVLVPATVAPVFGVPGVLGAPYAAVATVSGAAFVYATIRMARRQSENASEADRRAAARTVFLASIAHLPLLLIAMTAEALVRAVI
ncbi:MAG: heme o synthase [Phycisphaerales bacterium]